MEYGNDRYRFYYTDAERLLCAGFLLSEYGEQLCQPDACVKTLRQNCYEIIYVISGSGEMTAGKECYPLEAEDCVIALPGEPRFLRSAAEPPLRFAFLGFDRNPGDGSFGYLFDEINRLLRPGSNRRLRLKNRSPLLFHLFSELKSENHFHNEVAGYRIAEFLIGYIRTFAEDCPATYYPMITDDAVLVYAMETYIAENIFSIRTLKELEPVFRYDYQRLSRKFYAVTRKKLIDYFLECKMNTADRLLKQYSVTQVSEMLRYSSVFSFSRSYKRHFGRPPTRFRKNARDVKAASVDS